jgi:hypothetical protein
VFWAGGTEDSAVALLTLPSFVLAGVVGYTWPILGVMAPFVALGGGIAVGNATESFDNEYGALNFPGGLVIAEICVGIGAWRRNLHDDPPR